MAITYTWSITGMKKAPSLDGLTDVITHVNFDYKGVHDELVDGEEISETFQGATPIGAPDENNFTSLAELTEEDVIEWVKAVHPVDHMNHVIETKIDETLVPKKVIVEELPWESEEESTEEESTEE